MRVKSKQTGVTYKVKRFCDDEIGMRVYGRPFRAENAGGWIGTKQVTIIGDTEAQY